MSIWPTAVLSFWPETQTGAHGPDGWPGSFISYRRDDAGGDAGRLYDRLRERFGGNRVFRDVDTIEPGGRFPLEIEAKLARCDVLIALIGRDWLTSVDTRGEPRLQDRDDYVRLEIATALRRGIPVIPALLDKASMPTAAQLPADLAPLAQCQAIEIDETDCDGNQCRQQGSTGR